MVTVLMSVEQYSSRRKRLAPVNNDTHRASKTIEKLLGGPPIRVDLTPEDESSSDYWVEIPLEYTHGKLDGMGILDISIPRVGRISAQVTEAA